MSFTKLYLTNITAPYTPATLRGAWDDTAGQVTRALFPHKLSGGAFTNVARAETDASATWDVLLYRGVSGPLAAQTLSGNLDVVIPVAESNADADFRFHLHVYVTQGDSDTPRGTLITDYIDSSEWAVSASNGTGKALATAQAISLAVSAGDRIVIEVGYQAQNSHTTSRNGLLFYGTYRSGGLAGMPAILNDAVAGTATNTEEQASFVSFSVAVSEPVISQRVSQLATETLETGDADIRVSQFAVEALINDTNRPIRVSQLAVEILQPNNEAPTINNTTFAMAGAASVSFSSAQLTPGPMRATQVLAEEAETPGVSDTLVSQTIAEIGQDPNEVRVSHVVGEVGQDPNEVRVSHVLGEVGQGPNEVRVSQIIAEVAQANTPVTTSGDTRVTQLFLNILANRDAFTFEELGPCEGDGTVPTGINPPPGIDVRDAETPLVWVEFSAYNGPSVPVRAAKVAINIGPRIPPRLLAAGHTTRSLSDSSGRMEGASAKVVLNDTDRYVRGLIDTGQIFAQPATVFIADRSTIEAGGTPRRLAMGFVKDYDFPDDFQVGLEIEDQLTFETSPLAGDRQIPEFLIPSSIVDNNPPGDPEDITSWPAPLAYGALTDEDADEPEGVVPARYTMQSSMFADLGYSNLDFHLVCLGVVSDLQSAFVADTIAGGDNPTTRMRVPDGAWGDWIFAPYRPGWFLPNNWVEVDGRRWTFILMRQEHPAAEHAREGRIPIVCNVCGYENVGDGTGEMIASLPRQWVHFLINFVFNRYEGIGNWQTAIPLMPGQTYSVIDTASVELVKEVLDARAGQVHEGAFLLGHSEQQVDLDDVLVQFNRNMGVDSFFNKHGQLALTTLNTALSYLSAKRLGQRRDIGKGWRPDPRPDEVENTIKYGYARRYHKLLAETTEDANLRVREPKDVKFVSGTVSLPSPTAIVAMNNRIKDSRLQEYDMIRQLHLAHVLASFRLAWNRLPRFLVDVPLVDYYAADMELGEVVSVTHEQGLTATGWLDRLAQIRRLIIDTDNEKSQITIRDIQNLLGLVIGPDPEPPEGGEPEAPAEEPIVPEPEVPPPPPDEEEPPPGPVDPPPGGGVIVPLGTTDMTAFMSGRNPGTTYQFEAGTYRLVAGIAPRTGDIFLGAVSGGVRQTILSGGRVLTGWIADSGRWYVTGQTQQGTVGLGECKIGNPRCNYPEDLFIDNVLKLHVATLAEVGIGTWFFDYAADRIYIGDNPGGRVVETSVLPYVFATGSANVDNVRLVNLIVEKYAAPTAEAAVNLGYSPGGSTGWRAEGCEVRWCHGAGIGNDEATQSVGNYVHHNGGFGFIGAGLNLLVEDNEISYNNTCGYNEFWGAGGSKWVYTQNLIVRRNYCHHNLGPGLWTDINNINTLYEYNTTEYNTRAGIFHEVSYDAIIRYNLVRYNGQDREFPYWFSGAGIEVVDSRNVEVHNNTLVENWQEITGLDDVRSGAVGNNGPWILTGFSVHHNTVVNTVIPPGGGRIGAGTTNSFLFDHNTYYLGPNVADPFVDATTSYSESGWQGISQDPNSEFNRIGEGEGPSSGGSGGGTGGSGGGGGGTEEVYFRMTPNDPDSVANDTWGFASKFTTIPAFLNDSTFTPQPNSDPTWAFEHVPSGNYDGTGCPRITIFGQPTPVPSNLLYEQYNFGFVAPAITSHVFVVGDRVFIRWRIKYDAASRWRSWAYTFPANPVIWTQKFILFGTTGTNQSRTIVHMKGAEQDNSFCTLGGTNPAASSPSDFGITGGAEDEWYDSAYVHRYGSLSAFKNIELNDCVGPILQTYNGNTPGPADGWYHMQLEILSGSGGAGRYRMWSNNNDVNAPNFEFTGLTLGVAGWNESQLYVGGYMDEPPFADFSYLLGGFEIGPTFDPAWF